MLKEVKNTDPGNFSGAVAIDDIHAHAKYGCWDTITNIQLEVEPLFVTLMTGGKYCICVQKRPKGPSEMLLAR